MLKQVLEAKDALYYGPGVYWGPASAIRGMCAAPVPNPYASYSIVVFAQLDDDSLATVGWYYELFDPYEGRYVGRVRVGTSFYLRYGLYDGGDGTIWTRVSLIDPNAELRQLDPVTFQYTGASYPIEDYSDYAGVVLDRVRNRLITGYTYSDPRIAVYELSTMTLLYTIGTPGYVRTLCAEEGTRIWVIAETGVIALIDYETREILSVLRQANAQDLYFSGNNNSTVAWDRWAKRLLWLEDTPDDPPGVSTRRVRAYYPIPQPVALTQPLPLAVPRPGREVPVLVHAYGDTGESVAALRVDVATSGAGSARVGAALTDSRGDALFTVVCAEQDQPPEIDPALIDAGALQIRVDYQYRDNVFNTNNLAGVRLRFHDADGGLLGQADSPLAVGTLDFEARSYTAPLPALTRFVELSLRAEPGQGSFMMTSGFDLIQATVEPQAGQTGPTVSLPVANPGAEVGLLGWTVRAGVWVAGTMPEIPDGHYCFIADEPQSSELSQWLSLKGAVSPETIQIHVEATV